MDTHVSCRRVHDPEAEGYYDVPLLIHGRSILKPVKHENGLGGITLEETLMPPFSKNLDECPDEPQSTFDTTNWAYFMAFDGNKPVGGATVASRTVGVTLLAGRDDLAVLWDLRVLPGYRRRRVGTVLFDMAAAWAREQGLGQMKIECQNSNVAACKFYVSRGATLCAYDEYVYAQSPSLRHEIQLIWYVDLAPLHEDDA